MRTLVHLRTDLVAGAERLGAQLIVAIGNHDARPAFREVMLGGLPSEEPVDYIHWIGSLRIIVLDSTVPGAAHGEVRPQQLAWLASELRTRAEESSVAVLHHPPVPDATPLAGLLTLLHRGWSSRRPDDFHAELRCADLLS